MKKWMALFLAAALVCGVPCREGGAAKAAGKAANITLYRGKSTYLKALGSKKRAGRKYRYKSSRPKIISVSKKGKVRARKTGTAVITMRRKGKKRRVSRVRVRVVDYVTGVSLRSASRVSLKVGERAGIRAEVLPRTAGERRIRYTSSDAAVAVVSESGEITAVDEGMACIDVTGRGKTKSGRIIGTKILVYVSPEAVSAPKPVIPSKTDLVVQGSVFCPVQTVSPTEGDRFDSPQPSETGEPAGKPPEIVDPLEPSEPGETVEPSESGRPSATGEPRETAHPFGSEPPLETAAPSNPTSPPNPPQSLEECIAAILPPGGGTAMAANFVVASGSGVSTLYFLNRAYTGTASLFVDGVELRGAGSMDSLLANLEREVGVFLQGPYYTDAGGNSRRLFRISRQTASEPWVIQNRRDGTVYSFYALASDTVYGTPYGLIVAEGNTASSLILR